MIDASLAFSLFCEATIIPYTWCSWVQIDHVELSQWSRCISAFCYCSWQLICGDKTRIILLSVKHQYSDVFPLVIRSIIFSFSNDDCCTLTPFTFSNQFDLFYWALSSKEKMHREIESYMMINLLTQKMLYCRDKGYLSWCKKYLEYLAVSFTWLPLSFCCLTVLLRIKLSLLLLLTLTSLLFSQFCF